MAYVHMGYCDGRATPVQADDGVMTGNDQAAEETVAAPATAGARTREQVSAVLEVLAAREVAPSELDFLLGAVAACRWALGEGEAPVTGEPPVGPPTAEELVEEEREARMIRAGKAVSELSRDHARGAHEVLAWVCGYTDDVP